MIDFLLNHTPLFYLTQSLWRDEAFSVWIASGSLNDVVTRTSGDFNPPLYYLILNVWMKIFGSSEIALRSLSFLAYALFLWVMYKFAQSLFQSRFEQITLVLFSALNPMLVYFAFELRMYSFLYLFATLSTYFLYKKQYLPYIFASVAGLYTQPFMALVIISHGVYFMYKQQFKHLVICFVSIGVLYLPWIFTLITQFGNSGPMWMYPVDSNLIHSVIGNVFMGYEGTPANLWKYMKALSLLIVITSLSTVIFHKKKSIVILTLSTLFIPFILVLSISLKKPVYVHRYMIYTTPAMILAIALAIHNLPQRYLKFVSLGVIFSLLYAQVWVVDFHRKVNFQKTFSTINEQIGESDLIIAESPLSYFESWYYAHDKQKVYLLNPNSEEPPRYVGSVGMPKERWVTSIRQLSTKSYLVDENGNVTIIEKL